MADVAVAPLRSCGCDFFFQAEDGIRDVAVTGVQTCALPIWSGTARFTARIAYDDQGIVQQAIRAVKRAVPDLLVIGDVCLCEYTDHGHCGVIRDGDVDNDSSVYLLEIGRASCRERV